MNAKDLNNLNLNLKRFFDFDNHSHTYHFHIWKGQFSIREARTAATYADIAERFGVAIGWIENVKKLDRAMHCDGCGAKDGRIARVLSFSVMTGDDELFWESYDDLSWHGMIQRLEAAVSRLREMPEPLKPCNKCGMKRHKD
ncbi:MAG: hypothetical protein ACJ71Q_11145 [Terriglobales bacterium]